MIPSTCSFTALLLLVPLASSLQVAHELTYESSSESVYEYAGKGECVNAQTGEKPDLEFFKGGGSGDLCERQCDLTPRCTGLTKSFHNCIMWLDVDVKGGGDTSFGSKCIKRKGPANIVQVNGGDWTSAACPSNYTLIGGGCRGQDKPLQKSGPADSNTWECGGHEHDKTAFAICSTSIIPTIVTASGGDWTHVECPAGQTLLSGGCRADITPHRFQYNGPKGDGQWMCGGHGGDKTVWAFCAPNVEQVIKVKTGLMSVEVGRGAGHVLTGGGCDAYDAPYLFSSSAPVQWRDDAWACSWKQEMVAGFNNKRAWAMCSPVEAVK